LLRHRRTEETSEVPPPYLAAGPESCGANCARRFGICSVNLESNNHTAIGYTQQSTPGLARSSRQIEYFDQQRGSDPMDGAFELGLYTKIGDRGGLKLTP
jgi:hypothetical protein